MRGAMSANPKNELCTSDLSSEVSNACHDLSQLVAAGRLLTSGVSPSTDPASLHRHLQMAGRIFGHASDLLDQVVAPREPQLIRVNLNEVARDSATLTVAQHQVELVEEAPAAWVIADPVLLRRALTNIVSNAARADGQGTILVRVGEDEDMAWVEVCDEGPGFGAIEHHTGQGLSVVSTAVRASGGRLAITSGPGPGTAVRVSFPKVELVSVPRQRSTSPQSAEPVAYSSKLAFQSP